MSEGRLSVSFLLSQVQFVCCSILQVEYKLGFQVDNFVAMDMPQVNISAQGEVPRTLSGESQRQGLPYWLQLCLLYPRKNNLYSMLLCGASYLIGIGYISTLKNNFYKYWWFVLSFKQFPLFHRLQNYLCSAHPYLLFCIAGIGLCVGPCVWSCSSGCNSHTVSPTFINWMHPRCSSQHAVGWLSAPACLALLLHLPQCSSSSTSMQFWYPHLCMCWSLYLELSFPLVNSHSHIIVYVSKSTLIFSCLFLSLQLLALSSVLPSP